MDFPIFHLDFIGNRMLIAITAIVHVIINHPMAVGAIPMATLLEWIAHRKKWSALDDLAYKITFVFFVITTSLGAMTGVGIWFTTALVNPDAIGSL
ncbi:MAG TPA: cytochrome c, partial [bacterium]|nr:cytochrome c [bacterium]